MPDTSPTARPLSDRLTLWTGIVGSLLTVVLTAWNAYTKTQIDAREAQLRDLELHLKERSAGLEESRERVERYKWVLGQFGDLTNADERKRNFTVNLIRLALTKDEAAQLFTGFQTSSDTTLRSLGTSALTSIESEPIAQLVAQMNATSSEARKSAVAELIRGYRASSTAVSLALQTYDPTRIDALSPSAVINGLYFLANTDATAWDRGQAATARQVLARVEGRSPGAQTKDALAAFRAFVAKLPGA